MSKTAQIPHRVTVIAGRLLASQIVTGDVAAELRALDPCR